MKTAFFLSLILVAASSPLLAEQKVALVIGNTTYPDEDGGDYGDLPNCVRDAELISTALQKIGFSVISASNATRSMMDEKLTDFENRIQKGGTAVVYFAGHGLEYEKRNYLLGSNAKGQARSRLGEEAMDAETFAVAMMAAGAAQSFLFLDCCREKPNSEWATRSRKGGGLEDMKLTGDIIISFAARPGENAQDQPLVTGAGVLVNHGPYAQALAKWLPSGIKHTDLFENVRQEVDVLTKGQQRTWESGSFLKPFFFSETQTSVTPLAPAPMATSAQPSTPTASTVTFPKAGDPMTVTLPGGVKMILCYCPPGTFTMGSPAGEMSHNDDENQVPVTLSQGFWLAQTECTQAQWMAVMGNNPSHFKGETLPVEQVSWNDAQNFITRLNGATNNGLPDGWKWSLPTEAQWEYACRAGTDTPMAFGKSLVSAQANFHGSHPYGTTETGPFLEKTAPVGSYKPNDWALLDLHGNVAEWCQDLRFGETKLPGGTDPVGTEGLFRSYRGGGWTGSSHTLRSAHRSWNEATYRENTIGFRPAAVQTNNR
ncbi:MAG: SUMF1/EgtB/PvdO family nonheme iron enzyme [Verrucomicrobiaceae bacterium]|nr:SUMF1/EgtB/PvdO family nonheme iron enzyme [Verrucomicrobiaceae bacterium]